MMKNNSKNGRKEIGNASKVTTKIIKFLGNITATIM